MMKLSIPTIAAWAAALALSLGSCDRAHDRLDSATPTAFCSQLQAVNKLQLAQMTVSKMATIDDLTLDRAKGPKQTADALLNALKVGTRKAAYSYDTYIRAYINLDELEPSDIEIDEGAKHVNLRLPRIRIEFAGREPQIHEEHYRVTGFRSQIRPEERAEVKEAMNTALKSEVEQRPEFRQALDATARAKARRYFENFFASQGYTTTVEIR